MLPSIHGLLRGVVLAAFLANCGCGFASPGGATDPEEQSGVSILAKKRLERGQRSPDAPSKAKSR
jgi:hypothetical protein